MTLVPPHIARLVPYRPGMPVSEFERQSNIKHAIKLASNESPRGPSPKVIEAIRSEAAQLNRYPDGSTYLLRQDLAKHHEIQPTEIAVGNGSNELIDLLCRTFCAPDEDHVVFGTPSFLCYELSCRSSNLPFTAVPLRDFLSWDVGALMAAVTPQTKLLFVANPNNPTGAYVARADLETMLRETPSHVMIVVDEAYVEFPSAEDYASALTLRDLRERLIVLRTFSKAYGLAGLRVGYAVGPSSIIAFLDRTRAPFNVNTLAQVAARAALTDQEHVQEYVAMNCVERARLRDALTALGARIAPSQANFLLVRLDQRGPEAYQRLLSQGVITRQMPPPIDDWLRVSVGLPEENSRFLRAVEMLQQEGER